jgi:hypothetical protein
MPVQNYGAIMQGAADLTAMPANAFAQGQARRQAQDYRNSLLGMDQQRLSLDQQQYADQQAAAAAQGAQADEDDAEWDDAFAKKDWGRMARVDPQTTKILWEQEQAAKPQAPEYKAVGDALLEMPTAPGQDPRVAYQAPQKPQRYEPTAAEREWAIYQKLSPEQRELYDRMNGRNKPGAGGVTVGPDGQLMVTPDPSKATEGERVSANYLGRMEAAEQKLGDYTPGLKDFVAARTVLNGNAVTSSVANKALSKEGQGYYQAAADWVRAKLRKESGAVISPQEMEQEIKTYFPIPGDDPATVEQKRVARQQAMQGMRGMGGRAVVSGKAEPKQSNRRVKFEDL